eukprot:5594027-Pleurochrysis_carterae.AAC.1
MARGGGHTHKRKRLKGTYTCAKTRERANFTCSHNVHAVRGDIRYPLLQSARGLSRPFEVKCLLGPYFSLTLSSILFRADLDAWHSALAFLSPLHLHSTSLLTTLSHGLKARSANDPW